MSQDIAHHPDSQRFTLAADGSEAVLEYRLDSGREPAAINFTYTYVPPAFRGKGLAEKLVRHGLSWAREKQYDISASCWYVAKFLRQS